MKICSQCQSSFASTAGDLAYYKEWGLPAPSLCPDCRHQNRCAYRNERHFYKRSCSICQRKIVSIYSPDSPYPILCNDCWWGDKWDGRRIAVDFDFNRPFFEQFFELQCRVPRSAMHNGQSVNSDYCNQAVRNKDCYLLFGSDDNHDCMYSYWINRCEDTFNSSYLADCRQCIECLDGDNLHRCIYSQQMKNCAECIFCYDMIGCKNCFGCVGLRNVQYHIYNKPVKPEEYRQKLGKIFQEKLSNRKEFGKIKDWFEALKLKTPHRFAMVINSEDCTGDHIFNSRNCRNCYEVFDAERCRYCYFLVHKQFNCFDLSFGTEINNSYQALSSIGEGIRFSTLCWYGSNILYSDLCMSSEELFGCVGLHKQNHCVFNKKYPPDAYKDLRNKIVQHMHRTGEWGQFFPVKYSPFAYNNTVAMDFYPLNQAEVIRRGWHWEEAKAPVEKETHCTFVPDDIKHVTPAILEAKLTCKNCHKAYRIMKRELKIYQANFLPLPDICPDCRLLERLEQHNRFVLYSRKCDQCQKPLQTTYAPDRPEIIYCADCYYKVMY